MAEIDLWVRPANGPDMPRRTISGVMPAPRATPEQWADVLARAKALAELLRDIEETTGDPDIRALAEGAELAAGLAQERALGVRAAGR
jgi:hypothetical protein